MIEINLLSPGEGSGKKKSTGLAFLARFRRNKDADSIGLDDNAPAPDPVNSTLFDEDVRTAEPSLLNAPARKRPISAANADIATATRLKPSDLDDAEATSNKAGASWSVWSPILMMGVGLLVLLGFSLSLRRRTQTTISSSPVATAPPPRELQNPQSLPRRNQLDAIIDNQLPLTEERVAFTSPMQFHGRPQPPKTIRMDQRHALPKPHSPNATGVRGQAQVTSKPEVLAAPRTAATASQKFRIDRTGPTGTGTMDLPAPTLKNSSQHPISGTLDRALSAVQKREERGA